MNSKAKHWDDIYTNTQDSQLGWYEKDTTKTMELLAFIQNLKNKTILLTGAGTSTLIDTLLEKGSTLILNDISQEALTKVEKIHRQHTKNMSFLCQDISKNIPNNIKNSVDLWIDRAVLHFLLDEEDIKNYFENVTVATKEGAYVMFAEFSEDGAVQCAGLKVHRYTVEALSQNLGSNFELIKEFKHIYVNPFGNERPYVYALYKKI